MIYGTRTKAQGYIRIIHGEGSRYIGRNIGVTWEERTRRLQGAYKEHRYNLGIT